jgi:DNA-directed RNA polymerase subunit alpha
MLEAYKTKIECVDSDPETNYGRFVVEPLERGYGITLGNSMRRILLSSLEGAAVTSVKIKGEMPVLHEFAAIPGVVEDTTELILNLKALRLKLHSDETKTLWLDVEGEKKILASDIRPDADVDILNPDLVIATVAPGGKLSLELEVRKGRGYVQADRNKRSDDQIGLIPMDALFSPVPRVNFAVEDVRVGQLTENDRLILEVWTDGSILPAEAIGRAASIMIDKMRLFAELAGIEHVAEAVAEEKIDEAETKLDMKIDELELSQRSINCLKRAGITTVRELTQRSHAQMMEVRNLGKKSLDEIVRKINELGFSLQ